jgi:hypothetical protein
MMSKSEEECKDFEERAESSGGPLIVFAHLQAFLHGHMVTVDGGIGN